MLLILLLLVVSVCVGSLLRKCRVLRHLGQTATWTVWLLIFVFGINMGSNDVIVNDFARFGLTAMILSLAGIVGSVLAAWGIGRYIDRRRR